MIVHSLKALYPERAQTFSKNLEEFGKLKGDCPSGGSKVSNLEIVTVG